MMRLSTKSRYGARLMLELALNYKKGYMLLRDIADKEEISQGYLEHLIPPLKRAGFVRSSRGARGGYALAKDPSDINLREIVEALEGSLSIVECVDDAASCGRAANCVTRDVWKELEKSITNTLESFTLGDLAQRQMDKKEKRLLYHI